MKKPVKLFIKFLLAFIISYIIIFLSLNSEFSIKVDAPISTKTNQPIVISIKTIENFKKINPEEIKIEITNEYNNNDSYEANLIPFKTGEYSIVYTPTFEGNYTINISTTNNTINQVTTHKFVSKV